jgi:hypothetical protein
VGGGHLSAQSSAMVGAIPDATQTVPLAQSASEAQTCALAMTGTATIATAEASVMRIFVIGTIFPFSRGVGETVANKITLKARYMPGNFDP